MAPSNPSNQNDIERDLLMSRHTNDILSALVDKIRSAPMEDRETMKRLMDALGPDFDHNALSEHEQELMDRAVTFMNLIYTFMSIPANAHSMEGDKAVRLTEDDVDLFASEIFAQALVPDDNNQQIEVLFNADLFAQTPTTLVDTETHEIIKPTLN